MAASASETVVQTPMETLQHAKEETTSREGGLARISGQAPYLSTQDSEAGELL